MRRRINCVFCFALIVSFLSGCKTADKVTPSFIAPVKELRLKDLSGNDVFLSSYKGKNALVLFFWTTWCPYCREELKILKMKYPSLSRSGIELLAINSGEPRYKVSNFVEARGLNFKVLLDEDSEVSDSYGIMGVPTYFIIDKSGNTVFDGNSFPEDKIKELMQRKEDYRV